MRKEIADIIDAARKLGIRLTGHEGMNCVQISGAASEFPNRLKVLQQALDAYDRSSSSKSESEEVRLKRALDGVFRWLRASNIDVTEPMEIVGDALGVPPELRKHRDPTPAFVPASGRRKGGKSGGFARVSLLPSARSMGAVLPRIPDHPPRSRPRQASAPKPND